MNGTATKISVISAILLASVAAPLLFHHRGQVQWREQEALLRQQAGQIEELLAENKRLSNLVAQITKSSLSSEQFHELLRLRGEIGQLRREAGDVAKLKAAHQQRLAASNDSESQPNSLLTNSQATLAYWPKAQLSAVGYADPQSALQTTLLAMNQSDPNLLVASVTPHIRSELTNGALITALWVLSRHDPDALTASVAPEDRYKTFLEGLSPTELMAFQAKGAADSLGPASGFRVVGQILSENQAVLQLYFEGEGTLREAVLKKIGDEWKLDGIDLARGKHHSFRLWP